ncbi:hypothetical protein NEIRO03_2214 [Nematocida sp. AWRm78]|nr:hypothetical protein NEIRO02_2168 [Nematocida sp. AWRm79]KAI5186121.1 hypothetical protein NEIRO03_2214 [Nematocida sp. AWRm78]
MKLERPNRVIKNILFIPSMKNSVIIKLLLVMYTVCARLEMNGIVNVCNKKYGKLKDMTINQSGPLNPLRGYIIYKSGYMHNKRLYAPEINTKYSIRKLLKMVKNAMNTKELQLRMNHIKAVIKK